MKKLNTNTFLLNFNLYICTQYMIESFFCVKYWITIWYSKRRVRGYNTFRTLIFYISDILLYGVTGSITTSITLP